MDNTTDKQIDFLSFIADDRQIVSYRPRWNQLTGSITATILLQQIIYRWVHAGRQPFYKFAQPCKHPLCRADDSWVEELGLSRHEFESARGRIAVRTQGDIDPDALISYWSTGGHLTWYAINEPLLIKRLAELYPAQVRSVGVQARLPDSDPLPESGNDPAEDPSRRRNPEMSLPESGNAIAGKRKRHFQNSETPLPESGNGEVDPLPESGNAVAEIRQPSYRDLPRDRTEQRVTETATPPDAAAREDDAGGDVVSAVLRWVEFGDTLTKPERATLDPATALAWAYWIHVEQGRPTRPANAIGLARSRWRKQIPPPDDLLTVAHFWLAADDPTRRALLNACRDAQYLGEAAFEEIDVPAAAALSVFHATNGQLAPPSLSPPPEPAAEAATNQTAAPAPRPEPPGKTQAPALWPAALSELQAQMTRATFDVLLRGTTAVESDDTLIVHVRTPANAEWLANRLHPVIERTVRSIAQRQLDVRYEVLSREVTA